MDARGVHLLGRSLVVARSRFRADATDKSVDVEDVDRLPPPTHVHVAVVSCSGLRGSDWTGYADPFVEVGAFGADKKHRYRTSVAKMT